ncbi:MAG: hypothetical protein ACK5HP_02760 [Bacilli bacterium]
MQAKDGKSDELVEALQAVHNHNVFEDDFGRTFTDSQISQLVIEFVKNDNIDESSTNLANIVDKAPIFTTFDSNLSEMMYYCNMDFKDKNTKMCVHNTHKILAKTKKKSTN